MDLKHIRKQELLEALQRAAHFKGAIWNQFFSELTKEIDRRNAVRKGKKDNE